MIFDELLARLRQAPADPSLALLFPGQGAQQVGMGADLYQSSAAAREIFLTADSVLGRSLSRLCFEGPEEELRQTKNAQNAIMVTSLAFLGDAIESGRINIRPMAMAGHSLGEYTALVVAGSLTLKEAIRLVAERGKVMQEAGLARPGTMTAILALSDEAVETICRESGAEPCNYNAEGQVVVGGTPEAVATATALAKERGGKAAPLNVSGAFHTSLLNEAAEEFALVVDATTIAAPTIPVVGNVSGRPMTSAEDVRSDLRVQMIRPVLWRQSVAVMSGLGVETFVETGPGRVLTSLMKRTAPKAKAVTIGEL